ncbi:hypothetical protein M9458_055586, partial [Cirrhinus mrigala]
KYQAFSNRTTSQQAVVTPTPLTSRFLSVMKLTDGSQKRAEAGDEVMMVKK